MIFKNPGESVGCDISVEHEGDATNPWFGFVLADHQATGFGGVRLIVGDVRYVPAHEEWMAVSQRISGMLPAAIVPRVYDALVGLWESMPSVADPHLGAIVVVTVRDVYNVLGPPSAGVARWYGYVVDSVTGGPIEGVDVLGVLPPVTHPRYRGVSDKQGAFIGEGPEAGRYSYNVVQDRTYEPMAGTVNLVAGNNGPTRFAMTRILPPTVEEWRRLRLVPGARVR